MAVFSMENGELLSVNWKYVEKFWFRCDENGLLFSILADFWKTTLKWQVKRMRKVDEKKNIKRKQCDIMKNVSREDDYLYRNYAVSRQPIYLQSVAISEATWDAAATDNFRICISFSVRVLFCSVLFGSIRFQFSLLSYTERRRKNGRKII